MNDQPTAVATDMWTRTFEAMLFDMDGTILTSIKAAERVWAAWACRQGLDVASFLPTIHGVRSVDTIRRLGLPNIDAEAEAAAVTRAEIDDVAGIEQIAGAAVFLARLPPHRWAIVTSAPRALAIARIQAARIPMPGIMVAAEDVIDGKPSPEGYLLAAHRLGQRPQDCLVFEDTNAGIAAAEAAGAPVIVVTAAHVRRLHTKHPSIESYHVLSLNQHAGGRLSLAMQHRAG